MKEKQTRPSSRSRVEQMVQTLREEIMAGSRRPGSFLPSEIELCEQYELSNNTIRKGLDRLVAEGFVEKVPRIGTRVLEMAREEKTTIKFGFSPMLREIQMAKLLEMFHREHPGIRVLPIQISYPARGDRTALNGLLESVDVLLVNPYNFEQLMGTGEPTAEDGRVAMSGWAAENEWVAGNGRAGENRRVAENGRAAEDGRPTENDPAADAEQTSPVFEPVPFKEGLYPFLTEPFTRAGVLYAQPFVFTPVILCYNKEHFRECQVPEPDSSWTWQDVKQAGIRLAKGRDRFGLYFQVPNLNRFPLFLLQNGVVFEKDKQGTYNMLDPKIVESLQALMELIGDPALFPFASCLSQDEGDEQALFLSQKVSMVLSTYDRLYEYRDAPFAYDIAPVPYLREPRTLLHTVSLAVSSQSRQKRAARRFVDYMLSYEAQLEIRKATMRIPALKLAAEWTGEEPLRNRPSRFFMYRDIIPTFRSYTSLRLPVDGLMKMLAELKFHWSGLDTLDAVLLRLKDKLRTEAVRTEAGEKSGTSLADGARGKERREARQPGKAKRSPLKGASNPRK